MAALAATACDKGAVEPTISLQEANRRADAYVQRALAVLPPEAELDDADNYDDFGCDDPDDSGPRGRKFASRDYQLAGLNSADPSAYFNAFRSWWQANNFEIFREDMRQGREVISAENKADGFRMSLKANDLGELYLVVSSPCVWPSGRPEPEGK